MNSNFSSSLIYVGMSGGSASNRASLRSAISFNSSFHLNDFVEAFFELMEDRIKIVAFKLASAPTALVSCHEGHGSALGG